MKERRLARQIIRDLNKLKISIDIKTVSAIGKLISVDPSLQYKLNLSCPPGSLLDYVRKPVLDPYYWYTKCPLLYQDPVQWIKSFFEEKRSYRTLSTRRFSRWDVPFFIIDKILEFSSEEAYEVLLKNPFCPPSIRLIYRQRVKKLPKEERLTFEEAVQNDSILRKFSVEKLKKFYNEIVVPQSHQGKGFEWLRDKDITEMQTA